MTISLIIPFYDKLEDVLRCVGSLLPSAGEPFELLIQDDASPHANLIGIYPPEVVERNPVNGGFAFNCNQGAKRAHGDILVFCNQDILAVPGWSDNWALHLQAAFSEPSVGIVGARLLFPDTFAIQSAGGLHDAKCQPYHRNFAWTNPRHPEVDTPQDVSWVTGAWLAIRRELFEKIGGFDTAYAGGYFEDVELCGRVSELGFRIWYEPRCSFVHKVGSTGGNPRFAANARLFHDRWVKTGKIKPDTSAVYASYW